MRFNVGFDGGSKDFKLTMIVDNGVGVTKRSNEKTTKNFIGHTVN